MTWPRISGLVALLIAAVALVVQLSHEDRYTVRLELDTANGLRKGSQVKVGGAAVGTISTLGLGRGDRVVATLSLDPALRGDVRRDATASIVTSNLLGSKFVQLTPGHAAAPSTGTIVPAGVRYPVDLDQVLNVLDTGTRTRLQILINEAGLGLTGRRLDFSEVLQMLPQDLHQFTALLNQVVTDNDTLDRTVAQTSRFVTTLAGQRQGLSHLVGVAQGALGVAASRRASLRSTLERAPRALRSAQRFLAKLEAAATPLKPAAEALSVTARPLEETFAEIPAFQRAADPALQRATTLAPELSKLAAQATPVIRRARPTVRALATFTSALAPLSRTLDVSIDDVLALVEGWARAIQGRDGISHIFRAKVVLSSNVLRSLIGRLDDRSKRPSLLSGGRGKQHAPAPRLTASGHGGDAGSAGPSSAPKTPELLKLLQGGTAPAATPNVVGPLLNYLLGH